MVVGLQDTTGEGNPEPWLKVVAASLGVTLEAAVCVMTEGDCWVFNVARGGTTEP